MADPALGEEDRLHLERFIARMRRRGYLPSDFLKIESLAVDADISLFKSILLMSNPCTATFLYG